jgi:hypothetical protein
VRILEHWRETGPPLPIEDLYVQSFRHSFWHDGIVYVGFTGVEYRAESDTLHYLAVARHAATPTRFLGSTAVTPIEPVAPRP